MRTFYILRSSRYEYNWPMLLKADLTLLLVSVLWGSAFVFQRVVGGKAVFIISTGCDF